MLAEASTTEISKEKEPVTFEENNRKKSCDKQECKGVKGDQRVV